MTFEEWFSDMQSRYQSYYSGYEDLLREAWAAATESAAGVLDEMAADCEKEQEPTPVILWLNKNAEKIRSNK